MLPITLQIIDTIRLLTYNSGYHGGEIINNVVGRITVLWALSEAALGGVLHALRIPFTGLFIGSSAVIFISLIGYYSESRKDIMKSVLIVLLVKAGVSPYTPPAAYFAVSLQGVIGTAMFFSKKFYKIFTIVFGITVLTLSSLQKVILMTLVYGKNLWDSIDQFGVFITGQLPLVGEIGRMSLWIIGIYSGIHLYAGFTAGLIASRLPSWIAKSELKVDLCQIKKENIPVVDKRKARKRRMWIRKPTGILIFILAVSIVVLTYVFPHFSESVGMKAVIMLIRSFTIMSVWFFILSPYMLKFYKRFFAKKRGKYSEEVSSAISLLPFFKAIVFFNWKKTKGVFILRRIKLFLITTLICIFKVEIEGRE